MQNTKYKLLNEILRGSVRYELDDGVLTITGYYTGKVIKLDLKKLSEEVVDEINVQTYDELVEEVVMFIGGKNLKLNSELADVYGIADYIMQQREYNEEECYTVEDWYNDIKRNYPETFID